MHNIIFKNFKLILVWGLIFAIIAAGISLLLPKQYAADSQVLIISRDRSGVDPYTQAKSAERIGENLTQVMKTSDFYKKVIDSNNEFNKIYWKKLTDRKQRKKWNKDIQPSVHYGTGLMTIRAYSSTKTDAIKLSKAVSQTLATQGWEYVGGNVVIKVVSSPLSPRLPSRPNFLLNILIGLGVGIILAIYWLMRYKRHHLFN